jgi:serine/threonine protein kinase
VGPVKWMAPEQLRERTYSDRSDVFAIGVLLYEVFAQSLPWSALSNVEAARRVLVGERMEVGYG